MPKETYLQRFSLIIKRLEKGPATFEQIKHFLEMESDISGRDFNISKRTFQRDIKDIYNQLNVEILNEKKGDKRYFINSRPEEQEHTSRLLEAYEMVELIKASENYKSSIFFESRKPKGLEHFTGLLYAIKNKRTLNFTHYKFYDETLTERTVHPLALKESLGRWYLIAVDKKDDKLKTFGLDRINDLDISKSSFKQKYDYKVDDIFKHSFGVINELSAEPQKVKLSFTYEEGQYVKTYPLHTSQQVIEEGERVLIELYVYITYDFIMELMSFGEDLVVISPKDLIDTLKTKFEKALANYR